MNVLAISSFGTMLEVGLRTETGLYQNIRQVGLKHNQILLSQIDSVFKDADLKPDKIELIVCTRGPGSFTAIRIVLSTAKGLAAGAGAPFIAVPTFDIVGAAFSWYPDAVVPVLDGKKGKLYSALYRRGEKIIPESDSSGLSFKAMVDDYRQPLLVGEDSADIAARFLSGKEDCIPAAGGFTLIPALIDSGTHKYHEKDISVPLTAPIYLRKSDAELQKEGKT